jgi:hypothetical protein
LTGKAGRDRESQKTYLNEPHLKPSREEVVRVKVKAFIPRLFYMEGRGFLFLKRKWQRHRGTETQSNKTLCAFVPLPLCALDIDSSEMKYNRNI